MYEIVFDHSSRQMTITARGTLTLAVVATFAVELLARITTVRLRYRQFVALVDAKEVPVQSQVVIDAVEKVMAKVLTIIVVPTAVVVGSTLSKLQAERCFKAAHCRVFLDREEANAWLMQEQLADKKAA